MVAAEKNCQIFINYFKKLEHFYAGVCHLDKFSPAKLAM